jgi:hypothetical protein
MRPSRERIRVERIQGAILTLLLEHEPPRPWRFARLVATLAETPEAAELATRELAADGVVAYADDTVVATAAAARMRRVFRVAADAPRRPRRRRAPDTGQRTLADRAGLHPIEVEAMERGAADPTLTTITDLARALGVTASDLIEG